MRGLRKPDACFPRDEPASSTDDTNSQDAERILDPYMPALLDMQDCGQRADPAPSAGSRVATAASREPNVTQVARSEEGFLGTIGVAGGSLAQLLHVLGVVVCTLANEKEISEA